MKIYTRTGDRGTTALFGGDRVSKSHPRIDAYGTVDETNAHLGKVRAVLTDHPARPALDPVLHDIQHALFEVGADLATPTGARPTVPRITTEHVAQLEQWIDRFEADLPPLRQFILPGGTLPAAELHVARTVCRRAERLTVELAAREPTGEAVVVYLNRLSDLLFVMARWANHAAGGPDVAWEHRSS